MKSTRERIAVVLLALVCLLAVMANGERAAWDCPECGRKGNTGKFCGNCAHPAPEAAPAHNEGVNMASFGHEVGDIITFGHYEQDNELNNGQEAIEWIVLDYDAAENKALLLSRYGLDAKPYHEIGNVAVTWEKCSLRIWLHGQFLRTAFTGEEQQRILKTNVDNGESQGFSKWNTDGGNNTVDRIFLLSYREAFEEYLKDNESRICKPTAYAIAQGAYVNSSSGKSWWWLRSPGSNQDGAVLVNYDSSLYASHVSRKNGCVQPALWLSLDSGT